MDVRETSHTTKRLVTTKHWWWRLDDEAEDGVSGGGSGDGGGGGDGDGGDGGDGGEGGGGGGGDGGDGGGGGGSGGGGGGDGDTDGIPPPPPPPARPLDEISVGPSNPKGALTALIQSIRGGHATCRCFAHGSAHPGLVGHCRWKPCPKRLLSFIFSTNVQRASRSLALTWCALTNPIRYFMRPNQSVRSQNSQESGFTGDRVSKSSFQLQLAPVELGAAAGVRAGFRDPPGPA